MSENNSSIPSSRTSSVSFASSNAGSRTSSVSSSAFYPSRTSSISSESDTLHLPRIICLHGGGVSARIFRTQCRGLIRGLSSFRLVFVDAPFLSAPGPGIFPFFESWAPFRRWVRWKESDPDIGDDATIKAITNAVEMCKAQDEGNGPWVGILGFSQGAKVAASLLYQQQLETSLYGLASTEYKFGVLLAGRGPLISLGKESAQSPAFVKAGAMSLMEWRYDDSLSHKLMIPTIHMHGLKDPGLKWHRHMMVDYCEPSSGMITLVEWDGDHRLPIKRDDVDRVVMQIYRVAREEGVNV